MKTVIVFDTEDREGMRNTLKIMNHLTREYLNDSADRGNNKSFGKIQFIKLLRIFTQEAEKAGTDAGSLRFAKRFTDRVWTDRL